jgi:hypothetical protein
VAGALGYLALAGEPGLKRVVEGSLAGELGLERVVEGFFAGDFFEGVETEAVGDGRWGIVGAEVGGGEDAFFEEVDEKNFGSGFTIFCGMSGFYAPGVETLLEIDGSVGPLADGLIEDNLSFLAINDSSEIGTLDFIKPLKKLKHFSFVGTNVADGDLRPCLNIEHVGFNNKKHYSHTFEGLAKLRKGEK